MRIGQSLFAGLLALATLLVMSASLTEPAVAQDPQGVIPASFAGEVHYSGTFRYLSPPGPDSEHYGKFPYLEWNGDILLSITYYEDRVFGRYTGDVFFTYGTFEGTRQGSECTIRDGSSVWTTVCDFSQFNVFFESANPSFKGRIDTQFRQLGQRSPLLRKARVSEQEQQMIVAFGGEGSRPGGPNSWLTVMPDGFGKYFPSYEQSERLQAIVAPVLRDDIDSFLGAAFVTGSFSNYAYFRSDSAPGEIWTRMNFNYRSGFGIQDGWAEIRTINGQVVCIRHSSTDECKPPRMSIADQRTSLARFRAIPGPISIPASCFRYEEVAPEPGRIAVRGWDPNGAPIEEVIRYGSPGYTREIYTCPTVHYVFECIWGQYDVSLETDRDPFPFRAETINRSIARGDCVRTR